MENTSKLIKVQKSILYPKTIKALRKFNGPNEDFKAIMRESNKVFKKRPVKKTMDTLTKGMKDDVFLKSVFGKNADSETMNTMHSSKVKRDETLDVLDISSKKSGSKRNIRINRRALRSRNKGSSIF